MFSIVSWSPETDATNISLVCVDKDSLRVSLNIIQAFEAFDNSLHEYDINRVKFNASSFNDE